MKKVVFTFGRMNPPTIGHQKLVDKVNDVARSNGADARVYLSHTQNNKKDPLDYKDKIRFARKAFGKSVIQSPSKTVFDVAKELQKSGYTDIIMVVGSDRVQEFKKILNKYNGKDFEFDSIDVVSAGERDPDATGVEGMSASKLRKLATEGDFETFKSGLPKKIQGDAKQLYDKIRNTIKEEIEEQRKPLSIQQRREIGRRMKRLAPKLARMRKVKSKRKADTNTLKKRAMKHARNIIRKKVAGERGANYANLSGTEKMTVDKLVARKSALISKLSKRLLPKIRKAEGERLQKSRKPKTEEFDINESFDVIMEKPEVPQDPDVKDKPGTQPKKYYKGLSDKEKESRAKQFARQSKKSDDDPDAYKEPASNKDAETKPSKHTKKYHQMFGDKEESAVDAAKDRIEREKQADKRKHDAMMDRARTRDTQSKNTQTEEYELSEDASASLKKKSEKSGIPVGILRKVYNRGMAAWKTGHRPGASQQQWAFARVNSFITKGKGTWGGADKDLAAKARESKKSKNEEVNLDEKCWDTHKQVGMKMKDGKQVPNCVPKNEAQSPAQQAAIAISKKKRGEKPKNEDDFKPHMMYDPKTGKGYKAEKPEDHERMSKMGYSHEPPKKKNLKAMLGVPTARPKVPMGEETELEEMPRWLKEPLSKITHKKGYKMAKKVLADVLDRKKKEAGKKGLPHTVEYYAGQIARQFDGVDARVLADMVNEEPEKMDAPQIGTDKIKKRYSDMTPGQVNESYVFAQDEIQIQGAFEHHPTTDFQEDYLGWTLEEGTLEEAEYQGRKVKLRDPFRTPKGPKKFSVYVKNPKGNVIKVNFGDPDMEIKRDDPENRKNFRARHNCDDKTDDTKAGYWSCKMWQKGKSVSDLD
jgi:hypothetical protein